MFYSKLSKEIKKQFKTSNIQILETRAKCVAVAQRVWEGLYGPKESSYRPKEDKGRQKSSKEKDSFSSSNTGVEYPHIDSKQD